MSSDIRKNIILSSVFYVFNQGVIFGCCVYVFTTKGIFMVLYNEFIYVDNYRHVFISLKKS